MECVVENLNNFQQATLPFLIVLEHEFRKHLEFITPSTAKPNEVWMVEQARAFIRQMPAEQESKFCFQHDRDAKSSASFDEAIKSARGRIVNPPYRSPNLQAFVERFHPTLRREVLDHFLIFGQRHLDYLTQIFVPFYHRRRRHLSKENQVLSVEPPPRRRKRKTPRRVVAPTTTISLADVKCDRQLGGLLKHYHRIAA